MRYIYFVEGVVFVALSLLVARPGGMPAIIACSVVCSTLFSGAYVLWRISRYFNLPLREVGWSWFRPMGRTLLFYLPLAVLAWWLLQSLPGVARFAAHAIIASSVGLGLFLRYGLSPVLQDEILGRVPAKFGSILKRLFVKPPR